MRRTCHDERSTSAGLQIETVASDKLGRVCGAGTRGYGVPHYGMSIRDTICRATYYVVAEVSWRQPFTTRLLLTKKMLDLQPLFSSTGSLTRKHPGVELVSCKARLVSGKVRLIGT